MHVQRSPIPNWNSSAYKNARFHFLVQILFGETVALSYCKTMENFAPGEEARTFLVQQGIEEEIHLELLTDAVLKIERLQSPVSPQLQKLHTLMEEALMAKNWPESILIQNFVVEGFSLTLLRELIVHTDPLFQPVFQRIITDETRHVEFGVDELHKVLRKDKDGRIRARLIKTQRRALFLAVLLFKDLASGTRDVGMRWDDLAEHVLLDHRDRIKRAGLHLPLLDRLFLKFSIFFFVAV